MTYYVAGMNPETGFMAVDQSSELGKELRPAYQAGSPFPHIVIDDFLPPALLDSVLVEVAGLKIAEGSEAYDRAQERLKTSHQPDVMPDRLRQLFYAFNARPFIKVVENITGIRGLIPDPYFLGGGIHEIAQGGHLSIHADFNHHRMMNLERRVNVLIYLNKDWQPDFGVGLQLWDDAMTACVQNIVPIFNRCVIFNTTSNSQHGNPEPVAHPDGTPRRSIALYYYTSTWDGSKRSHTTQFQVRPQSADRTDWRVKMRGMKEDLLPPFLLRRWNSYRLRRYTSDQHPD